MSGKLYIVPTPIGNLGDITERARHVLTTVDVVLAEDTRTSGKLMRLLGIDAKLSSFHMHNEHHALERTIGQLQAGAIMALISDAGTPGISDPGFLLSRACVQHDIDMECLPGATAFLPALVISGLPCDRFVFEGFLPVKKGRQSRMAALVDEVRTMVFYESPHRIGKTLGQLAEHFGADRPASVSRELTKKFEDTKRGTLAELAEHFTAQKVKGEMVIIVAGKEK